MTLLLALLLAADVNGSSPDAGSRWERELYSKCPPAPPRVVLDGGWSLLSPERIARLDCIMVTADARVLQLEAAPPFLSSQSLVFAAIMGGVALLAGLYFGIELGRWWPF